MNIHEYQAKELLGLLGLPVGQGICCNTPLEVEWATRTLLGQKNGPKKVVLKSQIQAGGRGKAGGIKLVSTPEEALKVSQELFGKILVTPQTGPQGKKVHKIYVGAAEDIAAEYYLSLLVNREKSCLSIVACKEGGVDIEEVADHHPEKIHTFSVHLFNKPNPPSFLTLEIARCFDLPATAVPALKKILEGMVKAFTEYDASLVEINPLALTPKGELAVVDAKMTFDESALFRQKKIAAYRDYHEEDTRELQASQYNLSYISLDGNIGCMVNGAGLAMATMDIIQVYGGIPANFLDVGGGNSQENVTRAFELILSDAQVKGIFVNIFGGIMRCDLIAQGIIDASRKLKISVPLVVRLEGTYVEKGKELLKESGLPIDFATSMADGAQKIVAAIKKG